MNVVLISPYEIGRQPFGLAEPAAWLRDAGFRVRCLDLSVDRLSAELLAEADLIALYVAMHTATRIAVEALPQIRRMAPRAHLCAYGLYAPVNADLFHRSGVATVLGGECEPDLLALAEGLRDGNGAAEESLHVNLDKIPFVTPDRSDLPKLDRYAHLIVPGDGQRVVGFAEASRGCKHLCRHCPVVPVYQGRFRIVPVDVVMADVRQQIAAGARHVSFGDPDFFNGPAHALKVVRALHEEFPEVAYDVTIKIEHIIASARLLPELRETGCLFITSAVESVDDEVLEHLDKDHDSKDFRIAVQLLREAGIALAPTFVAFTPWTTLAGYVALLERLVELELVESVPPIQLAIRLLVPAGSRLLELPGFEDRLEDFDATLLGYPWKNADPRVDTLQARIQALAETAERDQLTRRETFEQIWRLAHATCDKISPPLPAYLGSPIPHHSEPWYCCAEPTSQQLQGF